MNKYLSVVLNKFDRAQTALLFSKVELSKAKDRLKEAKGLLDIKRK